MKVKPDKSELDSKLSEVKGAVATKNTMPILKGILITHDTILATDLEIGVKTNYNANVEETGAIVLPGKRFTSIVSELPDGEVEISTNDSFEAAIKANGSEFNLKGYDPEEFPQFPTVSEPNVIELNSYELDQTINRTNISTATDETQPSLTGILFEKGYATATNTYRMSNVSTGFNFEDKLILPADTAKEVKRKCKNVADVMVEYSDNYAKFIFGGTVIVSRLIEGEFPNWRQVLPGEYNTKIIAYCDKLLRAVKRASLVGEGIITLLTEQNLLKIESEGEKGNAHEEVECDIEGDEIKINCDASFLLDGLKVLEEDEVEIKLIDKLNPIHIEENNFRYIVMPIRDDT